MDGESYHTLNPFALDLLAYSEVYALTKSLNIGESTPRRGRVSKEVLIERIIEFHRQRNDEGHTLIDSENLSASQENLPMNVTGNNFAVLQVIPDTGERRKAKYPRSPFAEDVNENVRSSAVVKADVTHLRALKTADMSVCGDTPSKSILKKCDSPTSVQREYECDRLEYSSSKAQTPGKLDKITFSPFNAVKVIPHRRHLNDPCKQLSFGFGDGSIPEGEEEEGDHSRMEEDDEEEEEDEYDYYEEEEIYSDDETNNLVSNNTKRNSGEAEESEEVSSCSPSPFNSYAPHSRHGHGSPALNSHDFFEL